MSNIEFVSGDEADCALRALVLGLPTWWIDQLAYILEYPCNCPNVSQTITGIFLVLLLLFVLYLHRVDIDATTIHVNSGRCC